MAKLTPDVKITDAPVPATFRARKARQRTLLRIADDAAANALGRITPGCEIFAITNGHLSLVDILAHVLETTGPARLDVATWTAADGDLRRAHAFMLDGRVKHARFIVDPSFRSRKPEFCATLVELFGPECIRTTPIHGKFATIQNETWKIAIRTSMNLNVNRRIESVEISDDPALVDFLTDFMDQVFSRPAAGNFTSQNPDQNAVHTVASRLAF